MKKRLQHPSQICKYVGIPEPKYPITFRWQKRVTRFVVAVFGMLPAVDFDNKPFVTADKIGDVRADRYLSRKLEAGKTPVATCKP